MPAPSIQIDDTIEQGADWELLLLDRDEDGEDGEATDLTGCTAELKVWEIANPPVLRITLTSDDGGGITIDGPEGSVTCRITAAQSATLRRDSWMRLKLVWPSGEINWLARGRLSLIREVPSV